MKLFLTAESFSFSVIAMVCLSANYEWSQYLNSIGIGVLKFSFFLCLSLSFSSPRVRAYGEVSTRYALSKFSYCTFSNVFTLLLRLLLHVHAAPCTDWLCSRDCMIIVLLPKNVISVCDTVVNWQVRSAVFSGLTAPMMS